VLPALASVSSTAAVEEPRATLVYARAGDLFLRSQTGSRRRLTRDATTDGVPSWSPDRQRIVFARAEAGGGTDIWTMNADGTGRRRLAGSARGAHDLYPRFSPDGRLIVFASDRGGREADVYVMRADGTGLRRLVTGPRTVDDTQPSFSPDGAYVVFASNPRSYFVHELYRVRAADGGGRTRLTSRDVAGPGEPAHDLAPSYSPDGERIAFVSDRGGADAVWTMDARGRGLREVARIAGRSVAFPRFSPNGRWLVFTTFPDRPGPRPDDRLWRVRIDGAERAPLGAGSAADW
jgi:Tol biopolymer transport system component